MSALLVGILAARAAITNGVADAGDPAVVAIVDATGAVACTGTLIAPHVILTAAHCLIDSTSFDQFAVSFGAQVAPGALLLTDARAHPMFDPATLDNDLALLTLQRGDAAAPMALDPRAVDATWVGQSFTTVGFGTTGAAAGDTGTKRSGTATVTAVAALGFASAPSPSLPCAGDSGGPALFVDGGATVLAGVVSHGDSACADHATFSRVDVAQASFIQPYLAARADGTAGTGARCYFDEQCASGSCLRALDEPRRLFCSQPCAHDSDCPPAMICASDGCRYAAPSPGALGGRCAQADDCASGMCSAGACTRSCVPTAADCPSGFACQNTSDITFACVAVKPAGCDFGDNGAGTSWWMVALACAWWLFSREGPVRSSW